MKKAKTQAKTQAKPINVRLTQSKLNETLKVEFANVRKGSAYPNIKQKLLMFGEDALAGEVLGYALKNAMSIQAALANLESSYE